MSTIKTTHLQHPSASSPNLTLASSGAVEINGSMTGAGLDLITTQSFSAVSSVSLDNCFTGIYDNYRVLVNATRSASAELSIRMRLSGSDISTATYNRQYIRASGTTVFSTSQSSQTGMSLTANNAATQGVFDATIYSPSKAEVTFMTSLGRQISVGYIFFHSSTQTDSTAFDGMTLRCDSGTITGTVSVYGYANS